MGTAGPDWRPWLAASGSLGAQGCCTTRTERRRVLPQRPERQSFSFVSREVPPCSPQSRRLSCSAVGQGHHPTLWGSTTVEKAVLSTFFLVSALSYPKSTNTIKTSLPQSVSCSSPYRFPPLTSTTITRRAPSPGLQSTLGNTNEYKHPETRVGREEWPITRVQEQQLPPKDQPMILLNTTIDGKFPLNTTSSKF